VEPFVDAHILEQAVAVDRPPRAWQVDIGGQHRLLQLEVGVGSVEGRQEQLELFDRPLNRRGGEPADAAAFTSCHISPGSAGGTETEDLADLVHIHDSAFREYSRMRPRSRNPTPA